MMKDSEAKKPETLPMEEDIDQFFKQIRDEITRDGQYIFRGEPRKNREIEDGKIDDNPPVSSNLYRKHEKEIKRKDGRSIEEFQQEMLKDIRKYTKETDDDIIWEQLQHYGGRTNQIDFTTDYLIALFFACDGGVKTDGRLILLNKEDTKPQPYEPRHPQNRVIAQKSFFVRPPSGVVGVELYKIVPVYQNLKDPILKYLSQNHDIKSERIYNDIHGYIIQQKIQEGAHKKDIPFDKSMKHKL